MVQQADHNGVVAPWEGRPPELVIETKGVLRLWLHCCPHAQTLEAYSEKFSTTVWLALSCKQWRCAFCAQEKIRKLAVKTRDAKPNRLITLTVDPALWDNPRAAFDGTRRLLPELIRSLRTRYGEIEYLRVTEVTKRGWPHYHFLVRSPYIPHEVVKRLWQDLTGATIVDVRQVKQTFIAYTYLVKYLAKLHKIGWTERHVSYSKKFFPPEDPKPDDGLDLSGHNVLECHPSTYLYALFRRCTVTEVAYGVFALTHHPDSDRKGAY